MEALNSNITNSINKVTLVIFQTKLYCTICFVLAWQSYLWLGSNNVPLHGFYWLGVINADVPQVGDAAADWAPNEPSLQNEDCMAIYPNGWHDMQCTMSQSSVCEKYAV